MSAEETKDILKKAYLRIRELEKELANKTHDYEPIAIVGGALHFAGADTPAQLFDLLIEGKDMVSDMPLNRWAVSNWKSEGKEEGKAYSFAASYLEGIELFDNLFFNIPPEECQYTDPQQRLLLETTFEALQSAGIRLADLNASKTGVFIGSVNSGYDELVAPTPTEYSPTGSIVASASGKISYKLNLKGPALSLDTACSSSLTAIHLGCQSIHLGESDMAIAGGVNLILTPHGHIGFSQLGAMTTDGRAKVFDKGADGFSRGEGCGIVVLKKLKDAERDGDAILGVIRGSAMNHDGLSNGYTAPSQQSQEEVIKSALHKAGLTSSDIGYVEAHGTGTSLGDSIELQALHKIFGKNNDDVFIGSIKANLGHTEYAAGMASVFKTLKVLGEQRIPQQIHIQQLNPHFNWTASSLKVNEDKIKELQTLKYAGVSGFGISGTNVHLVLQRYDNAKTAAVKNESCYSLFVSAASNTALRRLLEKHKTVLSRLGEQDIAAYVISNNTHRDHFEYRELATGSTKSELLVSLSQKIKEIGEHAAGSGVMNVGRKTVFIFPGQGSQWFGMASSLFKNQKVFREAILEIDPYIKKYSDIPLSVWIENGTEEYLKNEQTIQPVLFAIQVALTKLWISQGIQPDVLIGLSMGEIAAWHLSGALSIDNAARIICRRSELMIDGIKGYEMCIAEYNSKALSEILVHYDNIEIGGYYSDTTHLLCGPSAEIQRFIKDVEAVGVFVKKVRTSVATHCSAVDNVLPALKEAIRDMAPGKFNIPVFSSVYNRLLNENDINAAYWADNLRRPILFSQSVLSLEEMEGNCFIEVSTHPLMGNYLQQIFDKRSYIYQPSLLREHECNTTFFQSLGLVYKAGLNPAIARNSGVHPLLPLYQWDKQLFPIPYENYGKARNTASSQKDLKLMLPIWQKVDRSQPASTVRQVVYCDFSGIAQLSEFDKLYNWSNQKSDFLKAIETIDNPLIVLDVAAIKGIKGVPDAIDALKHIVKDLAGKRADVVIAVANTLAVTGKEGSLNAAGYAWLGLTRSLQVEADNIIVHWIDTDATLSVSDLSDEVSSDKAGGATIFRNGERYKLHVHQQVCTQSVVRKVDAVLIIGGTSDMGLMMAEWYVQRNAKTIVLHGKRDVPHEKEWEHIIAENTDARIVNIAKTVLRFREQGINVWVTSGDLRDKQVTASLRKLTDENSIHINDVVYVAGTSLSYYFNEGTVGDFIAEADVRVSGWQYLDGKDGLNFDRIIFMSSASGFFRSAGQAPYLFANHWIDACAINSDKAKRKYISILWPIWKEVGRTAKEGFLPDTLLEHADNKYLQDYFNAIIDNDNLPPVVMAAQPVNNGLLHLWQQVPFIPGNGLREWLQKQRSINNKLNDDIAIALESEDELYVLLKRLWTDILGRQSIRPNDHFFQSGGNSVLLIKLVNRIKSQYPGIELKVPELIKNLSFIAQYEFIRQQIDVIVDTGIILTHAPLADSYPASEEQKQIWIQSQLDEDASLYNLTGVYAFKGVLNKKAFVQSINHIGLEQEIFRTRYFLEDGIVKQNIDKDVNIPILFYDVKDAQELDLLCKKLFEEESAYKFDLSEEHSFRIKIINCAGKEGALILNLHHIASDGWALGHYTTRLAAVYAAYCNGIAPGTLLPELTYKDYAVYQQLYLDSSAATIDRDFWYGKLSSGTSMPYLKIDRERPAMFEFRGKKIKLLVDEQLTKQVRTFGDQNKVSLYALLQAVLSTRLSVVSGEERIITGTPMSSRVDERLESVVGNFVNLLPVCVEVNGDKSFTEIVKETQDAIADVLLHQLYPFNRIVQDLKIKRDPSRHPVFDILFVLQNHTEADLQLPGLNIERKIIDPEHSKLDLFIEARELEKNIEFNFEFNDHLFEEATITRFWNGFVDFLSVAFNDPDSPLEENAGYKKSSNNVQNAVLLNAAQPFLEQCTLHPDKIAIEAGNTNITYQHLAAVSKQLTDNLSGLKDSIKDSPFYAVAVACGRSAEQVIGMMGAWMANMAYMPVNPEQSISHIITQLTSAKCKVLICNKADWNNYAKHAELLNAISYCLCFVSTSRWETYKIEDAITTLIDAPSANGSPVTYNEAAYIVFTSGTTGAPKAIVGRHDSLQHFIRWQTGDYGINETVSTAWLIQPTFDASFRDVLLSLYNGGTLHIPAQETWELTHALINWIDEKAITVIHIVPSVFRLLLSEIEAGYKGVHLFNHLQYIFLSGEALYTNDITRWQRIFGQRVQLVNFYGSSETTLIRTHYKIPAVDEIPGNSLPVGKPINDTQIWVVDENTICKAGETGKIYVQTQYPTLGYLSAGEIVTPLIYDFLHNSNIPLYDTGDLGYINEHGNLVVTGRIDDQVKVHGIRLHTGAIEAVITEIFNTGQLAVVFEEQESILKAYYAATDMPDIANVRAHIADRLSALHIPDAWIPLAALPLTSHGKVDRKALKNLAPQMVQASGAATKVLLTETEQKLATFWTAVLKIEQIGRDDNFFELGGNSLNGLVLLSRIHKELKRKISLRGLFANPVLADMAVAIDGAVVEGLSAIPTVAPSQWYPVSQAQRRMWILHNMEENSITYNIKRAYEVSGNINKDVLKSSFQLLIDKQESLRTNFNIVDGVPVQFIRDIESSLFQLGYEDLSTIENAETIVRKLANDEVQYNFNLETESLLRAILVKLGTERWVLLINMHHIISDGWSMELLMRELFENYELLQTGKDVTKIQLPLQYKDYSAWQQHKIDTNVYEKEKAYWLKELAGDIPILELPADNARAKIKTYEGEPLYFRLNSSVKTRIEEVCKKYDVSLYMFLLASVKVLLHKYSGQKDLIIGSPVAGREHPDLNGLVGFFVNMLALRSEVTPDTTFEQYLKSIRKKTLDAFEHQSYPFDKLVDELPLQRHTGRSPLFDITVQVLNVEFWEADKPGSTLKIKPFIADWQRSQFDLSFFFKEEGDSIFALIEFNNTIYSPKRIERLISHFNVLLNDILIRPGSVVGELEYLTRQEQQQLLYNNNDNVELVIPYNTVLDAINKNAHPDNIAIKGTNAVLHYGELNESVSKLSAFLVQCRQVKSAIGVLTNERTGLITAMLGIMQSGNIYLPLDPAHPSERLKYILNDAGAEVLVVTKAFIPLADKLLWECEQLKGYICIDSDEIYSWIPDSTELMRQDLWNYVGKQAKDDIEAGGWISSYTGLPFTEQEMQEYAENALQKVKPHLHTATRVLEVGCSSGLTLFKVAPSVASYTGIDLSEEILIKTRQRVKDKGLNNVSLHTLYADEIETLDVSGFDVIIINSVIQSFGSYNYFRKVIKQVIDKASDKAVLFLGDVQDAARKEALISSLRNFSIANQGKNYRTKITWDDELFFHQNFLRDLSFEFPCMVQFEFSDKGGSIKNELSLFRFDAIIKLDKTNTTPQLSGRSKWQVGASGINKTIQASLPVIEKTDAAYIIYTSGTSGNPKGVLVGHEALLNQVYAMANCFNNNIAAADKVLMVCRSTFDVSILEMFIGLVHGATLIEMDMSQPLSATYLISVLDNEAVTWAYLPPALLGDIADEIEAKNTTLALNKLLVGVEPIPSSTLSRFTGLCPGIIIVNGYGPTETTIVATTYTYRNDNYTIVPIGKPLPGYKVFIVDEYGKISGIGVPGEIVISGKGVAEGYINNIKLTAEKFKPGIDGARAYYTGDLGVWDANGNIQFVGRKDRQVKFNGYRIELSEIESQLAGYPGVSQAIALVIALGDGIKQLAVFIKAANDIEELDLKQYAASKLPEFMLPQRIVPLKEFPLTAHGKTDLKALEKLVYAPQKVASNNDAPVGKVETSLLDLYRSLLKQTNIGVTDNFFDLGGHSLIATRLVTRAAKEYGLSVPLVNVFIHPTVRELANSLPQEKAVGEIRPVEVNSDGLYPLSYAQNRLWIIDYLNPDDDAVRAAYNMVGLFEVKGVFNIDEFTHAIQLVIQNHEALRTNFVSINGEPYQKINERVNFSIEEIIIPAAETDVISFVKEETDKIASVPFNLENDLLIRSTYYKGNETSFVVVVMHHIISDGWSMHVFSKELQKALAQIRGEGGYTAPIIQYKDYAVWNKGIVEEKTGAKEYWHNLLSTPQSPTVIPSDTARPGWRTFNGSTLAFDFDSQINSAIQAFCAKQQVTLYSFLVAALDILIHRYTGLHTITIGSPVSGRTHAALENQLGFYLNNIVTRTELNGDENFIAFLSNVHTQVLQALQHQEYPFDKLVDDLLTERDTAYSPFFDIYLALQNNESPEVDFGTYSFASVSFDRKVSRYDLNFMFEDKGALKLHLQYNTDLFRVETIEAIWKHLRNIIAAVITEPGKNISQINLLGNEEITALLTKANANPVYAPGAYGAHLHESEHEGADTILYHFKKQVERFPGNIAVTDTNVQLTYRELDNASANLAMSLIGKGASINDVVALHIGKNIHRVVGILAVLKAGATYLPLDINLPHSRLSLLTQDAKGKLLLTDQSVEDTGAWFEAPVIACNIDTSIPAQVPLPAITGNTNAYILYTSGTTGKPKGVVVTHANVVSLMKETALYDFSEHDVWTLFHQYNFDFTVWEIWGALLFGGKLIVVSDELSKDLNAFADLIVSEKVTVLNQTPPVFYLVSELLLAKNKEELSALKYVIFGGDVLRPTLLQPFANKYPLVKLVNMYGITETTVHVTLKLLEAEDLQANHSNIGKAIPTLKVYILDEYMQLVPYGMPGQLAIAGKGLSNGYLNDEELTNRKFINHPVINDRVYLSGDLARFLPNGDIEYLGRIDHQVKIRGHRIEPGEVEHALQKLPLVQKSAVLKAGEAESSRLLAFIIPPVEWVNKLTLLESVSENNAAHIPVATLPNNMPLFHKNDSETRFMYREIVEEDGYMLRNLQLRDKPVIIDAGANIGMFSVLVSSLWSDAIVYAFEPMPEIFSCLSANAALYAPGRVIALNEGLSDEPGEAELHYYALNTVMSGGGTNDKELLSDYVRQQYAHSEEYSEDVIDTVVNEALDGVSVVCKIRTLSNIIDEYNLSYIDLVKIDVEEWEQKLMGGIRDEHWDIIGNLIAEVHDIDNRVAYLTDFLSAKGFNIEAQQTNILKGVALYNIKASRAKINGVMPGVNKAYKTFMSSHADWLPEAQLTRTIKAEVSDLLPTYMVPDAILLVKDLPLTANGKLDRNKLLKEELSRSQKEEKAVALNANGEKLLGIISEVLQRNISPDNNFFEIGGNSLNATQVVNRVRSRMDIDLKVRNIFEHPLLKDLAAYIDTLNRNELPEILPVPAAESYPLSDAQQRIFTTTMIEGSNSVAYNMTGGLLLEGLLDITILERALNILVERHEILRTRFAEVNGEFVQIPQRNVHISIAQAKVQNLDEVTCQQYILLAAATPFNLQEMPLVKCNLYQSSKEHALLVLSMHHIISDGWSMGVITKELAAVYNAIQQGGDDNLPELKFQYRDYCAWLDKLLNTPGWQANEKAFWQKELSGFRALELPYDYSKGAVQSYKGAGISHLIENWTSIEKQLQQQNISAYSFLLSVINVLFSKVSGAEDITVGTPVAGRPSLELEQQIGFYVNTLPVRLVNTGCDTFYDILVKAQKKSIEIFEHQLYPFNRIAEDVAGIRDMNSSPLFNVLFVWQNNAQPGYSLNGIKATKVDVEYESSIFDMSYIFTEVSGALKVTLQYNNSLFTKDTAEAMVTMLEGIIYAVSVNLHTAINEIEF